MASICVSARAASNDYGHTVHVKSVELGDVLEGEHFYRSGIFDPVQEIWISKYADDENPLVFTIDDAYFNSAASALPDDYEPLTDEDSYVKVIPQDFSEAGLAVKVKYSIMDGEEVLLDDIASSRLEINLTQGRTFTICLDLTPVPITFTPTIDPWMNEEVIEIIL